MTNQELDNILRTLKTLPEGNDELARTILKAAADSITLDKIKSLTSVSEESEEQLTNEKALKFSERNSEHRAVQPVSVKERAARTLGIMK